ncbi:N-acetyl sugar amidotransferase [Endozoicomonas numazuensis]|uniref:ExsB family protein n=1 Tax=Endozoicomonas numazuensis TaxID=1137799 RepID=A0A081N3R5_9GAMM|nr:N-acetyl sugar amidotransferase [Endozoicomonas numazuensis]KEQ13088.1 ExsB family protein [Endozoicomonas numazuensis]
MSVQVCNRCVMDTSAPSIEFDETGNCQFCSNYLKRLDSMPSVETYSQQLNTLVDKIKSEGQGKEYDCIIGVSGGVDSTYVAYLVKNLGLRPLAVHLDNGWNSELAVSNIEKTLTKLNIDLYTHVIDWDEFRDLQMSFLKASTPGMEIPSDHAIYAVLNKMAARYKIRYIINGSNFKMEYIMEPAWSEMVGQMDWKLIKNVHKQFGRVKLKTYPHFSRMDLYFSRFVNRCSVVNILDYVDFSKNEAMKVIQDKLGWVYYGGKHYESIYTRFTQAYIQPRKFAIDKRKAHYSNLICMGEMTRDEALLALKEDAYPDESMKDKDLQFFKKKMGVSDEEFNVLMNQPVKAYKDYKGYFNSGLHGWLYKLALNVHFNLKGKGFYGKREA